MPLPTRFPAKRAFGCLAVLAAVAALAGCVGIGGQSRTEPPTLGKQLTDLKCALDAQAITPEEYARTKQRLLDGKP